MSNTVDSAICPVTSKLRLPTNFQAARPPELPSRYNVIKRKQEASSEQYQENSPNYLPCHLEPRAFPERLKDPINFLTSLCRDKRDKGKDNSDEHTRNCGGYCFRSQHGKQHYI
jgi:hypothetical protein